VKKNQSNRGQSNTHFCFQKKEPSGVTIDRKYKMSQQNALTAKMEQNNEMFKTFRSSKVCFHKDHEIILIPQILNES